MQQYTPPQPYFGHQPYQKDNYFFVPYKFSKIDFPRFEGKDPRGWVSKCEKKFQLNPTLDNRKNVAYAALHLDGEADT